MSSGDESRLIAVRVSPGLAFSEAVQSIWAQGDAVLPVDPSLPAGELERLLDETRPALLVEDGEEGALAGALPLEPGVAAVIATSGTTGRPKAVELTHAALGAAATASCSRLGARPGDRWLCCLPLWHISGFGILARSERMGTSPVIHPGFDAGAIAAERDASFISLVPTMLRRLLDAVVDLSRFHAVLVGGGPISENLVDEAQEKGANVVTSYGATETCGGVVYDGLPLDGVDVRLDDGGLVAVRGPMLMRAYRNRPALTRRVLRDGWFVSSDVGELDARGRLRVLGRSDDVIVTGGEKVAPAEVEAILREHPLVADAAVVPEPDSEWGQRVVAFVVPARRGAHLDLADLRAFVAQRAAAYKAPQALTVIDELRRESGTSGEDNKDE